MQALGGHSLDEPHIKMFEYMKKDTTATIKHHTKNQNFPIKKGVRQGHMAPPKLLIICLKKMFKKFERDNIRIMKQ